MEQDIRLYLGLRSQIYKVEEACIAALKGGPVAMVYNRFGESTRKEAHQEYIESIAPYWNGAGYAIPGEFVVGNGYIV